MNISLEVTTLSNVEIIINHILLNLIIDTDTINDVHVYAYSISSLNVSYFLQDSPRSKLSIHYVSKISDKRIDSKISESNAIEFIKDDAVKSDKSYRQRVDVSF